MDPKQKFPFENRRLYVVVHASDQQQVLRNVKRAFDGGADGVFLINHAISAALLIECYRAARRLYPRHWFGLNFLGASLCGACQILPTDAQALWCDDIGVHDAANQLRQLKAFTGLRGTKRGNPFMFFGGVSFKGQGDTNSVALAVAQAKAVMPYVDFITTSGPGTGEPPRLEKILAMRQVLGSPCSLAIASGITAENVRTFLPFVGGFLVATGVSSTFHELDADKVRGLAQLIHNR